MSRNSIARIEPSMSRRTNLRSRILEDQAAVNEIHKHRKSLDPSFCYRVDNQVT